MAARTRLNGVTTHTRRRSTDTHGTVAALKERAYIEAVSARKCARRAEEDGEGDDARGGQSRSHDGVDYSASRARGGVLNATVWTRSACVRIREPRREGGGVEVEHDIGDS